MLILKKNALPVIVISLMVMSLGLLRVAHANTQDAFIRIISPVNATLEMPGAGLSFNVRSTDGGTMYSGVGVVPANTFGNNSSCGVYVNVVTFAGAGGSSGRLAVSGVRTDALDAERGSSVSACQNAVLSNFPTSITAQGGSNIVNPPSESSNSQIANVTVRINAGGALTNTGVAEQFIDVQAAPDIDTIRLIRPDGTESERTATRELSGSGVSYRIQFTGLSPGNYEVCSDIVAERCESFSKRFGQISNVVITADDERYDIMLEQGSTNATDDCRESLQGPWRWAFCGFFEIIDSAFGSLYNVVESMLIVQDNEFSGPEIRQAWGYFRNIATLALVVIGLVMIIGQAVSKE